MRTAMVVFGMAALAGAQDGNIHEVKFKYDKAIRRIAGVQDFSVGGVDGAMRLVVRVDSAEVRDAVKALVGDKLCGFPLTFIVAGAAKEVESTPETCTCSCHKKSGPSQTVAEVRKPKPKFDLDRIDDKSYEVEQCDMVRQVLGLPERVAKNGVRCHQMVGWTNDPERKKWVVDQGFPHWQSKEMPGLPNGGEIMAYTYIKHRQFCPKGMSQLLADVDRMTPKK